MPSNSYDLVVLGDDLAAMVCATLCARRGLRTLVLGDERPARYALGPHKLPVEPAQWPAINGTAGERVLKELHAELTLRRKLREVFLALSLENELSKQEIFTLFVNTQFLGQRSYGFAAAAETYYGKSLGDVDAASALRPVRRLRDLVVEG